jgi:hypothetical protein
MCMKRQEGDAKPMSAIRCETEGGGKVGILFPHRRMPAAEDDGRVCSRRPSSLALQSFGFCLHRARSSTGTGDAVDVQANHGAPANREGWGCFSNR